MDHTYYYFMVWVENVADEYGYSMILWQIHYDPN